MPNTIMPPDQTVMGLDAPMRFVFTYDPGGVTPKNIPILFSSPDANVQFDPPQIVGNPQKTDPATGQASVIATYKAATGSGNDVTINVTDPTKTTTYITATYTYGVINTGNLVLSPPSVPVAPDPSKLNTAGYTSTATVKFTKFGGGTLPYYPVGFQLLRANVHVYDVNGNELQKDAKSTYWFNMGSSGEAVEFTVSSEYEGVYQGTVEYGTGDTVDNGALVFTPELVGGDGSQFTIWPQLDLDSYPGPSITATIADPNLADSNVGDNDAVVVLVNGKVASVPQPCSSLVTGIAIQKQVFNTDGQENHISWMATTTSETYQSKVAVTEVTGDLQLHPPQDGLLPAPYTLGVGIINIPLILKGDVPLYVPNLPAPSGGNSTTDFTVVYYLNGWIPRVTPPEAQANSYSQQESTTTGGTVQVLIDAQNLSGYAANGANQGTFECYYYMGHGAAPTDKAQYSAPLVPIIPVVTG